MIFAIITIGGKLSTWVSRPLSRQGTRAYANILGDQLLRKLTIAVPEAVVHHRALCAFSEGL